MFHLFYSRWQHLCEQCFSLLFLNFQLFCPFPDQFLQVRGVLLQHPQHGVYDVSLLPFIYVLELRKGRDSGEAHTEKESFPMVVLANK